MEDHEETSEKERNTEPFNEESDGPNPALVKVNEYVKELLTERASIDQDRLPNVIKLIDQEITKTQQTGRVPPREYRYVDVYREKPTKVIVKVLVPVRENPKFNFVGKLLGPKGNSLKRLKEETMCKMAILGRGSMRDKQKEEELRKALDPKYAHLNDELHVEISAIGPPAEAHARVAFALAEIRKYLVPDNNDIIRQEQMREMETLGVEPRERHEPHKRSILKDGVPRPVPAPMRTATRAPPASLARPAVPAKNKIMSILDRARVAMEESYGYEDEQYEVHSYGDRYDLPSATLKPQSSSYGGYNYDSDYYRDSGSSYADPASPRTWKPKTPATQSTRLAEGRYRTSPYPRPNQ